MGALWLIAYVVVVGVLISVTTGWDRDKMPVVFGILIAAFIGWFVLIGMLTEGSHKKSGISVSKDGVKTGFQLFGSWLLYMVVLIVVGLILAILFG